MIASLYINYYPVKNSVMHSVVGVYHTSSFSMSYYLNIAPFAYYGLKPPVFKGRFAILILTIAVLCLRVKITPTAL
jgi:hypothetical protein